MSDGVELMNAHELLKNYIDENKIPYNDIAVASGLKFNTVKSGLYNKNLSFEKFGKLAVVSGFDVDRYIGHIAATYRMSIEECREKMEVYQVAMANRRVYKRIEELVAEAEEDTSFAVVCKMQKAAEAAEKKKEEAVTIPVPEELPELVEAVVNHESEQEKVETVEEFVEEKNAEEAKEEKAVEVNYKFGVIDVIRDIVRDMKGMQAVEVASLVQAIFQYRVDHDVEWLLDARTYLDILIKEHEDGWQ